MKVNVIKTVKGEKPMQITENLPVIENDGREGRLICVFPEVMYQEMKGFGGAFTEAAATTLQKLSAENQKKIIKMYFDEKDGIGYNIGRVHMNSCDFCLGNYACVEENDETLETFNIERDKGAVIPMIKDAMKYSDVDLFVSPWSPPAYMKTTGKMNEGGKLKEEYFELWSEFYVKFIEAYRNEGIKVWGITVQNEPKKVQTWDSCVYTAEEEKDFVKNYLGEKMEKLGIKIMFWDYTKDRAWERAKAVLADKEAAKYFYGIAIHWYSGDHFEQLDMFHNQYPDMDIVFTEGCYEYSKGMSDGTSIAEAYAHDMIGNFNNYCNMFCDWNLLLDEKGGPNHVGNNCDAPILADTKLDEVYVHDSYYYIGHFSKYVKKGARRIGTSKWSANVETVAFKNPDGEIVVVVLNRTETAQKFSMCIEDKVIESEAEAHSIATYIINLECR